jgi:hypothetical protein
MNVLNREVFDKQTTSIFPSWTSPVRSRSPAFKISNTQPYDIGCIPMYPIRIQFTRDASSVPLPEVDSPGSFVCRHSDLRPKCGRADRQLLWGRRSPHALEKNASVGALESSPLEFLRLKLRQNVPPPDAVLPDGFVEFLRRKQPAARTGIRRFR